MKGIARCPYCDRTVAVQDYKYTHHCTVPGGHEQCAMVGMRQPVAGHTPTDYFSRATLVTNLAWHLRDEDPGLVWIYLTALPANELQRMMVVALAAIPVDRSVGDLYGWVCALPIAKATA